MSKFLTRLSMLVATLFVFGGLAFGATEAFGSNMATACNGLGQLGECPSMEIPDDDACDDACMQEFGNPGMCFFGCCNCAF